LKMWEFENLKMDEQVPEENCCRLKCF
jgi:hypothetical protein